MRYGYQLFGFLLAFIAWQGICRVRLRADSRRQRDTLVVYIFSNTDAEYAANMEYFVQEAVHADTRADYVIVVQQDGTKPKNECYDWGTFGWLLGKEPELKTRYKYFLFVNSSVRGPFLPAYIRGRVDWTTLFIKRLTGDVKLVGSTISCEGSPITGDMSPWGKWRKQPHVQSYVVATDQVGLALLQDDGRIFHCHNRRWNAIYYSELGASRAVLSAGYNLDCLMTKYQGVDWRDTRNWNCNARYSPQGEAYLDGITLDPLEVMFVKVKSFSLENGPSSAKQAAKFSSWTQEDKAAHTLSFSINDWVNNSSKYKLPKILQMQVQGSACFDFNHYVEHNQDLAFFKSTAALWNHFVYYGQFEFRNHRFTCEANWDALDDDYL